MAYKGTFKTAYLQREIVVDAKVATNVIVGQLVTLSGDTISSAATADAATHIIAQSDMTMEYGHVPVEYRDYKYSDVVAASTTIEKKVALFKITNKDDLNVSQIS